MQAKTTSLSKLLKPGEVAEIAKAAGVSEATVSIALKRGRPGNRHVIEAMKRATASGALATAQSINSINA